RAVSAVGAHRRSRCQPSLGTGPSARGDQHGAHGSLCVTEEVCREVHDSTRPGIRNTGGDALVGADGRARGRRPHRTGGHAVVVGHDECSAGGVNLLPGTPLDGGRVLHGLLWRHTGDRDRATQTATTSGQVLGALLAGTGSCWRFMGTWTGCGCCLSAGFSPGRPARSAQPLSSWGGWLGCGSRTSCLLHLRSRPGGGLCRHLSTTCSASPAGTTGSSLSSTSTGGSRVWSIVDLTSCPPADRRNVPVRQLAHPLSGELVDPRPGTRAGTAKHAHRGQWCARRRSSG